MAKRARRFYDIIQKPGGRWKRVRWNGKYLHSDKTSKRIRAVAKARGWKYRRKGEAQEKPLQVVPRAAWGASPSSLTPVTWRKNTDVWVHHTVGLPQSLSEASKAMFMRGMQSQHKGQGWSDIGYNYVIFADGTTYEGRGHSKHGAHNPGHNTEPGIAFAGNFMNQEPTAEALKAFKQLKDSISTGRARPHRATYATACPGNNLVKALNLET